MIQNFSPLIFTLALVLFQTIKSLFFNPLLSFYRHFPQYPNYIVVYFMLWSKNRLLSDLISDSHFLLSIVQLALFLSSLLNFFFIFTFQFFYHFQSEIHRFLSFLLFCPLNNFCHSISLPE